MKEARIKKTPNQIRFEKAERASSRGLEKVQALESRLQKTRDEWLAAAVEERLAELQVLCDGSRTTIAAFERLHFLLNLESDSRLTAEQITLRDEINRKYPQQKKAAA